MDNLNEDVLVTLLQLPKITRLTVVDDLGRAYERYNVRVEASLQDDGRTLKLFVQGNK